MNEELHNRASQPTLILLSGLLCDDSVWANVVPDLQSLAECKTFAFPGFSTLESMAEHVLAHAPARFALAGHSMGGRVALEIMRVAPSRVMGLALLHTGVHGTAASEAASRGTLVDLAREDGMRALAAAWLPPMLGSQLQKRDTLLPPLTEMVERYTPETFAKQIQALLNRPDARGVLAAVEVPVMLLSASEDAWSPPHQHVAMRELCPGARLTIIQDAGHMSPVEEPVAVASALASWLQRVLDSLKADELPALERALIREACTNQIYKYARLNDRGSWEALTRLFTETGTLYRPSDPLIPLSGRARILESFSARGPRLSHHVISNVEVTVESPADAHAISTVVLYLAKYTDGQTLVTSESVGYFFDHFSKVGAEWLFTERRGSTTMRSN